MVYNIPAIMVGSRFVSLGLKVMERFFGDVTHAEGNYAHAGGNGSVGGGGEGG